MLIFPFKCMRLAPDPASVFMTTEVQFSVAEKTAEDLAYLTFKKKRSLYRGSFNCL